MVNLRPFVFSKPNQHHFMKARFDISHEASMRLDAANDEYMIGL